MAKKLFIGGLSWDTDDDGLRQAFERFGAMDEVKVITDRETGRSRGFGFVTFAESDAATSAVSEMDGTELDGRTIGAGGRGPLTEKLQTLFFDAVHGRNSNHPEWLAPIV